MSETDELERARKDAERYRFLRKSATFQYRNGPGIYWYLPRGEFGKSEGERLDDNIDAALERKADSH
jgi:hypothetical protein